MKERPIIFSSDMVAAILRGDKTQTRRVVKPQPLPPVVKWKQRGCKWEPVAKNEKVRQQFITTWPDAICCPFGLPGDRLWVRETWFDNEASDDGSADETPKRCVYRADGEFSKQFPGDYVGTKWQPSIHMPRWASRITLEITGVRVERLQDISEEDARAEGAQEMAVLPGDRGSFIPDFAMRWDGIHGAGSWAENPWVWVITFRKVNQ